MDKYDDLLLKARSEMVGKTQLRKEPSSDIIFNYVWDNLQKEQANVPLSKAPPTPRYPHLQQYLENKEEGGRWPRFNALHQNKPIPQTPRGPSPLSRVGERFRNAQGAPHTLWSVAERAKNAIRGRFGRDRGRNVSDDDNDDDEWLQRLLELRHDQEQNENTIPPMIDSPPPATPPPAAPAASGHPPSLPPLPRPIRSPVANDKEREKNNNKRTTDAAEGVMNRLNPPKDNNIETTLHASGAQKVMDSLLKPPQEPATPPPAETPAAAAAPPPATPTETPPATPTETPPAATPTETKDDESAAGKRQKERKKARRVAEVDENGRVRGVKETEVDKSAFAQSWSVAQNPFANPFDNPNAFAIHDNFKISKNDDDLPKEFMNARPSHMSDEESRGNFSPKFQDKLASADTSLLPQGMLKQFMGKTQEEEPNVNYSLLPQGWQES